MNRRIQRAKQKALGIAVAVAVTVAPASALDVSTIVIDKAPIETVGLMVLGVTALVVGIRYIKKIMF